MIFNSQVPIGGAEALYIDVTAEQLTAGELEPAIAIYSERSRASGALEWEAADVLPPATFRLYRATATSQSVLGRGDQRLPVTPA